jgi:diguanylate cyclase (GGDEF)-like protein
MLLVKLSNLIKLNIRKEDTFCRIEGEEFIIIAPNINSEDAISFTEKLRKIVQEYDSGTVVEVIISIGVGIQNINDTVETFFKKVDEAVYTIFI